MWAPQWFAHSAQPMAPHDPHVARRTGVLRPRVWRQARSPLDVHADRSSAEIQFGHVQRPTHTTPAGTTPASRSARRWLHVGETGYGLAVGNDSTYGHDVSREPRDGGSYRSSGARAVSRSTPYSRLRSAPAQSSCSCPLAPVRRAFGDRNCAHADRKDLAAGAELGVRVRGARRRGSATSAGLVVQPRSGGGGCQRCVLRLLLRQRVGLAFAKCEHAQQADQADRGEVEPDGVSAEGDRQL